MEEEEIARVVRKVLENYTFEVETPQHTQQPQQPQPKKCVGPNCNHTVKPNEKYCPECLSCPECGTINKPEEQYCEECNAEFTPLE